MSAYPGSIDSPSTLYAPVDAFSTKPLETTASSAIAAGDTTINVATTGTGFAAAYGVLSIDDELIVYTGRTSTSFTGCQRGAFGTTAAAHANGVEVKANMVSGFLTALQSAVIAVETELGTAAAPRYVRSSGAQTVTGLKTFQDGAEFGSGTKASTGLVRLPNAGGLKWRKSDGSGDLGIALNAANHLVADAIIDFAPGQIFGAPSYPDATTTSKGIVQIDPVGGIGVNAGVISLVNSGVTPGSYAKVTVDQKGRVTAGANLAAGDIPAHSHIAGDIVSGSLPFSIQKGGALQGTRRALNLVEGSNVTLTVSDDPGGDRVNVTMAAAFGSHTHPSAQISDATANPTADTVVKRDGSGGASFAYAAANNLWAYLDSHLQSIECGPYQTAGGAFENMAKHSENWTAAWDTNGGSWAATANAVVAPDGNQTADTITAMTATPVVQQQIAGLNAGGTYTFYIWAKAPSGTVKVSLAIVDNAYAGYLAGPSQVTLTTAWQRFKITGTLAAGQTGLWIVVRQFDSNGDTWTSGAIHLWGACLQQGNDPKKGYARTLAAQIAAVSAGMASGPVVIAATSTTDAPLRIYWPNSNLADKLLFGVNEFGEVTIAGRNGNGYMLSEVMGATNPSGWSGVIKVKNPAGVNLGYILLYSNP